QIPNKDSTQPGGANLAGFEQNQAIFARSFQPRQLVRKIAIEIDAELARNFFLNDDRMAEQAANYGAPQAIVFRQVIAAHGSNAALRDRLLPCRELLMILRVGVLNSADRRHAHAIQVRAGFCRVTLKIAMQRALPLRNCQFIFRLREVIHADIQVAGFEKLEQAGAKNLKFLHALRQVRGKRALLLLQPRHVGIAEQRHAIRGQLQNLLDRVGESLRSLKGQAINQVHIDAVEAQLASGKEQIAGQFKRLNAVNGLLHVGMEVLDSHAQAIESQAAQSLEVLARSDARVDFNTDFRVGG